MILVQARQITEAHVCAPHTSRHTHKFLLERERERERDFSDTSDSAKAACLGLIGFGPIIFMCFMSGTLRGALPFPGLSTGLTGLTSSTGDASPEDVANATVCVSTENTNFPFQDLMITRPGSGSGEIHTVDEFKVSTRSTTE